MIETAEPIEILAAAAALAACGYSLRLFAASISLAQSTQGRRPSVRTIAWAKAASELVRCWLASMVLWADLIQMLTPAPASLTWSRPWLQLIWVLLGAGLLFLSGWNDLATKRVMSQIEQEAQA